MIEETPTPALLVDKKRLEDNIRQMAEFAKTNEVNLRPHIKTHKCLELADLQRNMGAKGITVSTLGEAKIFAKANHKDIMYAVPIAPRKIPTAMEISQECRLKILVDNKTVIGPLEQEARHANTEMEVLLKVDVGYHRCGVLPNSQYAIDLAKAIRDSPHLMLKGILTHGGQSYDCSTRDEVRTIAKQEQRTMIEFAKRLETTSLDLRPEIVSIGSTPTMRNAGKIEEGITEIRPGNYVFYDYTQVRLGSCEVKDCALSVLTTVIGKYDDRIIIDAGATALSVDPGPVHIEPDCGYGKILAEYESGTIMKSATIIALSQEHGKVMVTDRAVLGDLRIGDQVRILPNHSCLTANLAEEYYIVDGNRVLDKWSVHHLRV